MKFLSEETKAAFTERMGLEPGDVAFFIADKESVANASLNALRPHFGET